MKRPKPLATSHLPLGKSRGRDVVLSCRSLVASGLWLVAAFLDAPTASAQTKPTATNEPGRWTFAPARDDFRPDALLDLRGLNEKEAGESGFVKTDANGDFLLGNGKAVRFWAVNTDVAREKPFVVRPLWSKAEPDLAHHARFLAKRGVNMVRCHAT